MELTLGKKIAPITNEGLDSFSKPALLNHALELKLPVPNGPISKDDLIDILLDHYEPSLPLETPVQEPTPEPTVDPEPEQPAEPTVFIPSPSNAPTGMVYCKHCMSHVPKSKTVPTSEQDVYVCLMGCKKASGMTQAAKAASQAAKAKATPSAKVKSTTTRKTLFADTDIIKHIKPRTTKGLSAVAYGALRDGMTVKEFCDLIATMETGAITGRGELKYDVDNGYITVTPV